MRRLLALRLTILLLGSAIASSVLIGCGDSVADGTSVTLAQKGIDAKKAKIEEIRKKAMEDHKPGARKNR